MNKEKKVMVYDHSKLYKEKIHPLVNEIKKLCAVNDIPFFFSFAIASDEKGTKYDNDGFLSNSTSRVLKEDKFPAYLAVVRGFEMVPKTNFGIASIDDNSDCVSDPVDNDIAAYISGGNGDNEPIAEKKDLMYIGDI